MRLAVEPWAPEYGSPTEEGGYAPQEPAVLDLEMAPKDWEPLSPGGEPVGTVYFVDGVQRIEANVVVTLDSGEARRGRCVSYGAGVVRCDGRAEVIAAEIRHEFLAPDKAAGDIPTRHGTFTHYGITSDESMVFVEALHKRMAELEAEVARAAAVGPDDLLITDGPLSGRRHGVKHAVGYVKTHPTPYLPEELSQRVVAALAPRASARRSSAWGPVGPPGTCACPRRSSTAGRAWSAARRATTSAARSCSPWPTGSPPPCRGSPPRATRTPGRPRTCIPSGAWSGSSSAASATRGSGSAPSAKPPPPDHL